MLSKLSGYKQLLPWIVICLATGLVAGFLQSDALQTWYPLLHKSPLTPPGWAFFAVWTVLYIMMGISIGLARREKHRNRALLTAVFIAQLAVNFLWCMGFFVMRSPGSGLFLIIILLLLLLLYTWKVWPLRRASACLFIPYILWVTFAIYLNSYIFFYN